MSHDGARTTVCHMFCRMTKKTNKNKQNVRRRIYLTFAFSERHVTAGHLGDIIMSHRVTL